jgi:glycosyltransferase involved in cell wall biosynthesis
MPEIWFWQRIVSPHIAGLAVALAEQGCDVHYVAENEMSPDRSSLGWSLPEMKGVDLRYVRRSKDVKDYVATSSASSVHLCQGVRANGTVSDAQKRLADRGLRHWVLMETIQDTGWIGPLKRFAYKGLFRRQQSRLNGVLAIGYGTPDWVTARGIPPKVVFPFAYFLRDRPVNFTSAPIVGMPFRFAFAGQFVGRKRLPMVVDALASLPCRQAELIVAGSGPLERIWRAYAERHLPGRVRWVGGLPSAIVLDMLGEVDCLVLPSRHDGWGAVVSEALMSGTPAICSDRCGAAGVVASSGVGGVFAHDNPAELASLLARAVASGPPTLEGRTSLAQWATSLGARTGARYLLNILAHVDGQASRPAPPWSERAQSCAA